MHSFFPFSSCFFTSLIIGTVISVSANRWLTVWLGLELNLISFLPLIINTHTSQETESSIKYFLVQAIGSGFILIGGLSLSFVSPYISYLIISLGLILKLGVAPLHFWLPSVIRGIRWVNCLILTTWQKLAPLFLCLSLLPSVTSTLFYVGALSALIGGLGGINQTSMRALLAYSSIGHVGWLVIVSQISETVLITYFVIYILISTSLFFILLNLSSTRTNQISSIEQWPFSYIIIFGLLLLSLGGVPPLTGFAAKWLAVQSLIQVSVIISFILILGSLISLYYYLILFFSLIAQTSRKNHLSGPQLKTLNPYFSFIALLPIAGLGLVSFLL